MSSATRWGCSALSKNAGLSARRGCWTYIYNETEFFIYGFYDIPEQWRPNIVFALSALLFVPQGTTVDKLLHALVGVTLFTSAYMAEVVRGGLQAVPRGTV